MIVVDVSAQDSPEVSLVEDDHVIETLAPNASNDPFDVGALPRGARRRRNLLDVESRNAPLEGSSPNFPVKSPYGSPGSVKLLVPPTCFWGGTRFEVPRFS